MSDGACRYEPSGAVAPASSSAWGLFEAIVHSHDVTAPLGALPIWGPRIAFAAGHVLRAGPAALARHGAPDGTLAVHTGEQTATLRGTSGKWELTDATAEPRARLQIEHEDLVLATAGRLAVSEAITRAEVSGDRDFARAMLDGWQILAP